MGGSLPGSRYSCGPQHRRQLDGKPGGPIVLWQTGAAYGSMENCFGTGGHQRRLPIFELTDDGNFYRLVPAGFVLECATGFYGQL